MPISSYFPQARLIDERLPAWLRAARPDQVEQLSGLLRASLRAQRRVHRLLMPVQSPEAFCRPLLLDALARWFPERTAHALETDLASALARQRLPGRRGRSQPWLAAAMQNYPADAQVTLYESPEARTPMALEGERFAKGVRNLDLGQRYQDHLNDHMGTSAFHGALREHDRAAFAVAVKQARLQGQLDLAGEVLAEMALEGTAGLGAGGRSQALECAYLSVFDLPLAGPLLLRLAPKAGVEPCVLYIPGDPAGEVRGFSSVQAAYQALTVQLRQAPYRQFFLRFVARAEQPRFAARLRALLYPRYPYAQLHPTPPVLKKGEHFSWIKQLFPGPHELWQETLDENARVPMAGTLWAGDCFVERARTQVQRHYDDARALVVPVAQLDAEAQWASLEGWLGVGLNLLNVAALFIPGLGEAMLVVGGAQLVDEFLDGVHAANDGDSDAAVGHLFSIISTLVQAAAVGAASGIAEPPGALHGWLTVPTEKGPRLWSGDLAPFARAKPWPAATVADNDGLYRWQGHAWATLDEHALPVQREAGQPWQLKPAPGVKHTPRLWGNGDGAWRLAHERPHSWAGARLVRRLLPGSEVLDDATLLRAARCSGFDEAALRRLHVDHQPAPALLLDSIDALGGPARPLGTVHADAAPVARAFPGLSPRALNELLARARPQDLASLRSTGRVPLALGESARLYLREGRIDRALARFHQPGGPAEDRDLLVIDNLARLPGWTGKVSVALREGARESRLVSTAGPEAGVGKTVLRTPTGYEPRDKQGLPLAGRVDIYQAILNALPDSERLALGIEINQPDVLRDRLFTTASAARDRCAQALGLPPIRPLFRLPTRLPGGRGVGYRLSGRGRGWLSEDELFDELFPASGADDRRLLRQRLRHQAGTSPGAFGRLLEQLRREYTQLSDALEVWAHDTAGAAPPAQPARRAARQAIAQRLRHAWRYESPGQSTAGLDYVTLNVPLRDAGELPTLPVRLEQVRHLALQGDQSGAAANIDGFITAFPHLEALELSGQQLQRLPASLAGLERLQTLDVGENRLNLADEPTLELLASLRALRRLSVMDAINELPVPALQRLAQLPQLEMLHADLNDLALTAEHFNALAQWPALRGLSLGSNEITLDAAARQALAQLNRLNYLFMEENPLTLAPDLTGWHALQRLDLSQAQLSQWPAGLEALLRQEPLVLREIDIGGNLLVDAPDLRDSAFARAIGSGEAGTVYEFDDNPFSEAALRRLAGAGLPALGHQPPAPAWVLQLPPALRQQVQLTFTDAQWQPLYQLFERVSETAAYYNNPTRMAQRMEHVLAVLTAEGGEAQPGWGRAEVHEHILNELNDAAQTCVDQASLLFQQVENQVFLWEGVSAAAAGEGSEATAVATAAGLLRQSLLDERIGQVYNARVARRQALASDDEAVRASAPALHPDDALSDAELADPDFLLDELEMVVYARRRLEEQLGLPPQPRHLIYDHLARLSDDCLGRLADSVQGSITYAVFTDWALRQPFWQLWLRRLRPQAFTDFERQWEGASDYFGALNEAAAGGAYSGGTVPEHYLQALEQAYPQVGWRAGEVTQRVDLVSGRYEAEGAIYEAAARLLVSSRQAALEALMRRLTGAMLAATLD